MEFIDIVPGLMADYIIKRLEALPKGSYIKEITVVPSGGGGKNVYLSFITEESEKKGG